MPTRVFKDLMWKSKQLETFWSFLDQNIWSRLHWKSEFCAHKIQATPNCNHMCTLFNRLLNGHQKNRWDFQ